MKSKVVRWKHGNHRQGLCVGYVESKREGRNRKYWKVCGLFY